MKSHCCERMALACTLDCDQHESIYDCPDVTIACLDCFDEYGIIIRDGGQAKISIDYCPLEKTS